MKKKLIIFASVVVVLLGCTFLYIKGKRYEVVITQDQIDDALEQTFPVSKDFLLIFNIQYSNPAVTLLESGNKIRVGLDAVLNMQINKEPRNLGGSCSVIAGIRYDSDTHEFFLSDAKVEKFEIQGIPEKYLKKVTLFAEKAANEYLVRYPVYRLQGEDIKTTTAKLLLKEIKIENQKVHLFLGI